MKEIDWKNFFDGVSNFIEKNLEEVPKTNSNILINKAFNLYLEFVKNNRSEGTYEMDSNHIGTMLNYFQIRNIKYFNEITNLEIEQFKAYSFKRNNKASTINKRIGIIKRTQRYLIDMEVLDMKPYISKKLHEEEPEIEYLKLDQVETVINYANTKLSVENRIIVKLLIQTGMRRSDITRIKIKDISKLENKIYISTSKTKIPRTFFIDDTLMKEIESFITNQKEFLFENKKKQPIKAAKITSMFVRMKHRLNIDVLAPHKLRHTYATYLIRTNNNIADVKKLLGHKTITMTNRYIHANNEELKDISINNNPMSLIKNHSK